MNTWTAKLMTAGVLFLITIVTGVITSRSGRPLSFGLVTIHKLAAVVAVVLAGIEASRMYRAGGGAQPVVTGMMILSTVLFLALIATGALLTREEMQLPALVLKVHQTAPLLAAASSAFSIYLMVRV